MFFNETQSSHRRKSMKKLITSLLCTTICGTVLTTGSIDAQVESSTNSNSLKELQDEGVVSKSITEEQWKQIQAKNREEEAKFERTAEEQWQKQQKQDQIDRENRKRKKKFHLKKGDYFITNGVSAKGLTGHAAIYVGNGYIKEARGYGKSTRTKSFRKWKYSTLKKKKGHPKHRYISVYRASKKYRGKARNYAKSHFNHVPYNITPNPYSKGATYCSKLVWQSYYYGAGPSSVRPFSQPQFIIYPYALHRYIKSKPVRIYTRG